MDAEELEVILQDPKKAFNLLRVLHQLLHLYDRRDMEEKIKIEQERNSGRTAESVGIGDQIGIVVKGADGNVKKELNQ